jgi:hypothetical protein
LYFRFNDPESKVVRYLLYRLPASSKHRKQCKVKKLKEMCRMLGQSNNGNPCTQKKFNVPGPGWTEVNTHPFKA